MKNTLPESLLSKLFDATGSASGGNKGFILVTVNANGDPTLVSRVENSLVHFGLRRAMELFLDADDNNSINQ
jgi:hypothetical protein